MTDADFLSHYFGGTKEFKAWMRYWHKRMLEDSGCQYFQSMEDIVKYTYSYGEGPGGIEFHEQ